MSVSPTDTSQPLEDIPVPNTPSYSTSSTSELTSTKPLDIPATINKSKSISKAKAKPKRAIGSVPNIPLTTTHNYSLAPPVATSPTTIRRRSFNVFTTASFLSGSPPIAHASSLPRMMTTLNIANRLAGGRVKDQTIHHSFSDRSSTHTKPAPSQDQKGQRSGYSADGLKRISNGLGREWEGRVAPCAWEPIAIPIMRLDEPDQGWASAQAFFREGLSDKLDVYVRDVRIREPNDDFQHEYELIRTAAEKAGKSDTNEATIAHAEALAHTASLASLEGNLLALIRIWSELDEEMEGWIRSEMALLADEFKDRQAYPEKYQKLKMERKAALKRQMAREKKAENARKKLELKEVKRKMQEEQEEREKMEDQGKKEFGIGQDAFWPMEKSEDWTKKAVSPESSDETSEETSTTTSTDTESGGDSEEEKARKAVAREMRKKEKEAGGIVMEKKEQKDVGVQGGSGELNSTMTTSETGRPAEPTIKVDSVD